jgi:hypothetical protein
MRFHLSLFLILSLVFIGSAQASGHKKSTAKKVIKPCQDLQVLSDAAQESIDQAMANDTDDTVSDYLILSGDAPVLEKSNIDGNDLWQVPVVVEGEGCYGNVDITVQAGTCTIVGKPSFSGVHCTDD